MRWSCASVVRAWSLASGVLASSIFAEGKLPVSVPVKSVGSSGRSTAPTPVSQAPFMVTRTEPALPGQRYPQYQLHSSQHKWASQIEEGAVRFLIAAPSIVAEFGRPLLVQVTATIDGRPFDEVRREQAEAVAADAAKPRSAEAVPDEDIAVQADGEETMDRVPRYAVATQPAEIARRYREATGETLEPDEATWLLSEWIDGPPLLLLNSYFQTFRVQQRPAFVVLDRDEDGVLSSAEIETAEATFERCDVNRDDVVDVLEVSNRADALRDPSMRSSEPGQLLFLVDEMHGLTKDAGVSFEAVRSFDRKADGVIDDEDLAAIREQTPDVEVLIAFDTQDVSKSRLTIVKAPSESIDSVRVDEQYVGLTFDVGSTAINLTAAQSRGASQVSLGAVIDGFPLLPMLDPNDDGRLTIRERRQLVPRLQAFDSDGDGAISSNEAQSPVRICIGLGPVVHRELASLRTPIKPDTAPMESGPEWFARMDRNSDNDLSRKEFPGTDEQFGELDTDGDQLISIVEANTFEKNQQK